MAGLIFGLSTVCLVAPGPTDTRNGRQWSDSLDAGRRASDHGVATQIVVGHATSDAATDRRRETRIENPPR